MISNSIQDYLKAIYRLAETQGTVSTTAIAVAMDVAPASVTNMVKRLAEMRLVRHTPYYGVELTPSGRKIALEVIRHHRLLEAYLKEALGYSWDTVHAEAEKLEHHISEEFEDKIAATLGNPTHDPHGDPIPTKDGQIAPAAMQRLTDAMPGHSGRIVRVSDEDPELLRYLAELGITPQATFMVTSKAPFDGPLHIRLGERGTVHALGRNVTDQVFVEEDTPAVRAKPKP